MVTTGYSTACGVSGRARYGRLNIKKRRVVMKHIKKLLCAVLTVVMMVSLMSAALAAGTFVDVPEDSPYAEYIEDIYARGTDTPSVFAMSPRLSPPK